MARSKISIRRSLIWANVLLTGIALLLCAVGIYVALYRPLLRGLADSEMARAADRVTADVTTIFDRVEAITRAERQWGRQGLIDPGRLESFDALLGPLVGADGAVTSLAVAADSGAEILLLTLPEDRRLFRLTDPDRWGSKGRFLTRDASGRVVADEQKQTDYDARQRPWFQAAMAMPRGDEVHWTAPYTYVSTGEPGVSAVLCWTAPDGHRYAMTNDVRLRDLTDFAQAATVGLSGLTAILTDDGKILGLPRDARFATPDAVVRAALAPVESLDVPPLSASFRAWQKQGRPDADIIPFDASGMTWFASFHRIRPAGQTFWIATLAPTEDFRNVSDHALTVGIGFVAAAMAAASLAALWLGTRFSRPIEELSRESARIGQMDLARPIATVSPMREIDALAGSLEEMRLNFISARQELESKAELERQLTQARKIEAVGQLAAGIAHDFNNILGGILGFAGFLVEDLPPGSPQSGFARRITEASTRAKELVEQILCFSRVSTVERQPTDLVHLVGECEALLRTPLPPATELEVSLPAVPLVAEVNAGQISQILMNLCINARDAMNGAPGRIVLDVAEIGPDHPDRALFAPADPRADAPPEAQLQFGRLEPTRLYARIRVADTGAGMDEAALKRIFEPFYTTKERGKGTGLGLSVVHGIVLTSDGACLVTSRPQHGSTFAIYLPLVAAPAAAQPVENAAALRGEERVLVVDDETMITDMLTVGLERLGYQVTAMNDPRAALDAFAREPARWDVVVSDQAMPHLDGVTLFRALAKVRPSLPFVLCSGFAEAATEESAAALGISIFLIKPVQPERLSAAIRRLLDRPRAA